MTLSCPHCGSLSVSGARACETCGAPVSPERLAAFAEHKQAIRRRRWKVAGVVASLLLLGGGGATWQLTRRPPPRPIVVSADPYVASLHAEVVNDVTYVSQYSGEAWRSITVVVENRGANLLNCAYAAVRVVGLEDPPDISRHGFACDFQGDALLPGERDAATFEFHDELPGAPLEVVFERVEVGPPVTTAPALTPLTVAADPKVGVTDLSGVLTHTLRAESLTWHGKFGSQWIDFRVTAKAPHTVHDLSYELRLLDGEGKVVDKQNELVAWEDSATRRVFAPIRPGETRAVGIHAHLETAERSDLRWELVVTALGTR